MRVGGGVKGGVLKLAVMPGGEGPVVVEVAVICSWLSMRGDARWHHNRLRHLHMLWVPGGEHVVDRS